ncbi:late competence protein ComER [Paenibacillus macerans]|uniref:late competence protein ComER n=1 Tax=Paenibacillus macerans TaxID=44252 RepID=UPI00203C11DB|nr:late competence protein ComER [Paenibacillus macerans]
MKVAFIGTGSMGSLLIEAFSRSGALLPHHICASNRSPLKTKRLAQRYPGLKIYGSNAEAARDSKIIFLCIKPLDYPGVIEEIRDVLDDKQIVVSITSPVQIETLEQALPAKIAKIIPSITHSVHSGASLCMYGKRIRHEDRLLLEQLMSSVSTPFTLKETETRIASDISSCGPAFITYMLQLWAEAAGEQTGLTRADAITLGSEMLLGTGKLLTEGGLTTEELIERVAVPGGVTAEGLAALEAGLRGVFAELIGATHRKYDEDLGKLHALFNPSSPGVEAAADGEGEETSPSSHQAAGSPLSKADPPEGSGAATLP